MFGSGLARGEISDLVTESGKAPLLVERQGIVNLGPDPRCLERFKEPVAVFGPDNVLVEDMERIFASGSD